MSSICHILKKLSWLDDNLVSYKKMFVIRVPRPKIALGKRKKLHANAHSPLSPCALGQKRVSCIPRLASTSKFSCMRAIKRCSPMVSKIIEPQFGNVKPTLFHVSAQSICFVLADWAKTSLWYP